MADEEMEGSLLDLSDRGLTKLDIPGGENPTALIADRNSITRVENLDMCPNLRQLSLKSNRLVQMVGVSKLRHLTVLNLPQNSIIAIEGVKELTELAWLNLSGNSIKSMDNLSSNIQLKHLDLSDNSISLLGDIHHLNQLKTLLLHGNILTSLKTAPHFLPKSISIYSLAENEIADINEVSFLSCLPELQQLSVMNNPCVLMTASVPGFDYRPYIVNWCPGLEILDGYTVTEKETLKAEWLYSQGRGHHYKLGQHLETIQYLASVCPLTASVQKRVKHGRVKSLVTRLESAEDAKLSQILTKQRYHQRQLVQTQQQQQHHWNIPNKQGGDNSNVTEAGSPSPHRQPVRAWSVHADSAVSSGTSQQYERVGQHLNDLSVQDVTSEDYDKKSTSSLLDSESMYLPVDNVKSPTTPTRPMTAPVSMLSAPVTQNLLDILTRGDNRPATAIGDNKYDAYDKRPIKPMNQEMYKGIFKPDFNVSQPQISGNGPIQGAKKKVPPTAQAMDYDTSQETSQIEQLLKPTKEREKENAENIPVSELSLIREKVRSKSAKSKLDDTNTKSAKVTEKKKHDYVHSHGSSRTSIPVAKSAVSRTQSEYVPGKYSHRPSTTENDSRVKGKTIKSIAEKSSRGTDRLSRTAESKKEHNNSSLLDSGIYSRPTSDAVLAEDVKAATKIQSYWRGYYTREHDVDAVRVRREIRARRAEEHIVVLRTELDKQRQLYEQEKQLRTLQLEAIRHLWKEVQSLQNWKNEVLQSQAFLSPETKREHEYNSYNSSLEIQNTLARAEMLNKMGDSGTSGHTGHVMHVMQQPSVDNGKQKELEKTCVNLQSQVSQLQEALTSVSSLVLQSSASSIPVTPRSTTSSLNTTGNTNKDEEEILVTGDFDEIEISEYESLHSAQWGTVPHSLSPYPSEEEESYFRSVPQPGFPTPPRALRLENRGLSALVLRWQPSKILDSDSKEMNKPLLGYRVFVNDKAKAMIAGTKQKALIEGLDPSLTYKIYVKAVSDLGESNSSDVVMAALSKGRRRSSSSDSNRSYDSDRESTSSERPHSRRKDSRRSNRKTKSPRSSHSRQGKGDKKESSHKDGRETLERPPSKMELEAEGIMTQPKLHTHRRTRSKDLQNKKLDENLNNIKPKETPHSPVQRSPKSGSHQESQGFSFDDRTQNQSVVHSQQSEMSSTFTVDSQNSMLQALTSRNIELDMTESKDEPSKDEPVKGHRRRRSKDMKNEQRGDVSDSSSSVSSANVASRYIDSTGERNQSGTDSPSAARRRRSRDSNKEDSDTGSLQHNNGRNSAKISPTAGSQGVPVIDGRRRHGSGSRPSSPAHSDISDSRSSIASVDKKRQPMADLLEQRFSGRQSNNSAASSTATLTQSQVDNSVSDLPPQIPRRDSKYSSLENLSSRSSHDYNRSPTERTSPISISRRRTDSTCSESDVPSNSTASRQLDMDSNKNNNAASSGGGGIVAKLLQKLQTFSKTQEESLHKNKYKRKSGEPEDSGRKASGDSDISESLTCPGSGQGSTVHSDSSGVHSDDSQQVHRPYRKQHRRTSSDHRGILIKMSPDQRPPSLSQRTDHSPVIMDSSKQSSHTSSNNIKRHASFHGILPSKKEDPVNRRGSTENLSEKQSPSIKQQNIDITVPTTPTRRHRHRSRSRSPSSTSSHVPIISAAQLQRPSKVSTTPS